MVKRRGPAFSLEEGDAAMSRASAATKSRPTKRVRIASFPARPTNPQDRDEELADESMTGNDIEMTDPSTLHLADELVEDDQPLDTISIADEPEEQDAPGHVIQASSSDSARPVAVTEAEFLKAKADFEKDDAADVMPVGAGKSFIRKHRTSRMKKWTKPVDEAKTPNKLRGIHWGLRPLSDMQEIFDDLTMKAVELGFLDIIKYLGGRQLNVATMCSGTDSPMLALQMITEALWRKYNAKLRVNHLFSAEIVPKKSAFIERNFHPPLIFSDLREVGYSEECIATTAYGAKADIPQNVDLLIAGFPCVDFSGVNPHKKTLGDLGESGDVLLAMINYAKRHRPSIIVLENVEHCQWELTRALWGNDADIVSKFLKKSQAKQWLIWDESHRGYASEWYVVDTKQYYLPHTRRRGYMFLVCKDLIRSESEEAVMHTWLDNLERLKRPTSVSILDFLIDEDDPRLEKSQLEMSTTRTVKAEVDWEQCRGNYLDHRITLGLGDKRPLTEWVDGGTAKFPDNWLLKWCSLQVERIWETFDSNYLRQAIRNKQDPLYKLRVWELSQNVYRDKDTAPMGITGCLTPTGNPFPPAIGRPFVGLETLALGGLPIERLLLTRESPRELTDLAGNAMTTTVVAAATISAMIAGGSALRKIFKHRKIEPSPVSSSSSDGAGVTMDTSHLKSHTIMRSAGTEGIPLEIMFDLAVRTARLCRCEGPRHITREDLRVCKDCGHLCCYGCSGTPAHNYGRLYSRSRPAPHIFKDTIKSILPMRVLLDGLNDRNLQSLVKDVRGNMQRDDWEIIRESVLSIVGSELRFCSVKRSKEWTVNYDSICGRLQLTIGKNEAHWLMYGKVDANEPGNSRARTLFKYPIAQMTVRGADLLQGLWRLGAPASGHFKLSIKGVGDLIPSWRNRIGLDGFDKEFASESIQVTHINHPRRPLDLDIARKYHALPKCGTACNSLYRALPASDSEKFVPSFFLDPDLFGKPKADRFVFAIDPSKMDIKETRRIICSLQDQWSPTKRAGRTIKCATTQEWLASDMTLRAFEGYMPATYAVPGDDMEIDVFAEQSLRLSGAAPFTYSCRTSATVLLSVNVPIDEAADAAKQGWMRSEWRQIPPSDFAKIITSMAWLVNRTYFGDHFPNQWHMLPVPSTIHHCRCCVPQQPATKWRRPRQDSNKIVPQEYGKDAAEYERALKARPPFFFIRNRIDDNDCNRMELAINVATLAHRATAKLGLPSKHSGLGLVWRFDPSYKCPTSFDFKRLKVVAVNTPGHDAYSFPNRQFNLRPEQRRSLSWMIGQESPLTREWKEQEIEEAFLPSFGWRAEVRASYLAKVYGGILADVVGYGKTVTSLALIDSQRDSTDEDAEIVACKNCEDCKDCKKCDDSKDCDYCEKCKGCNDCDDCKDCKKCDDSKDCEYCEKCKDCDDCKDRRGFISLKATLIVVPPTLVSQWAGEVKKFLGDTHKVLTIQSQTVLSSTTIAKFMAASIIIVNIDLLKSEAYWGKVALFAALPDNPPLGGRPFDDWHDQACEEIRAHVLKLQKQDGIMPAFADYLRKERYLSQTDPEVLESVPTKRLRGAKYLKWDQRQSKIGGIEATTRRATEQPQKYNHIANAKKWQEMKSPCFEMFRFTRTIFDEHTYIEDRLIKTLGSLNAKRRWILSGTPPLTNFADVWKMGVLINAKLGVQDDASGVITQEDVMVMRNERSESENFRAFATTYTPAWHEARHRHAQAFLDQFARQNFPEGLALPREFLPQPTIMYSVERIVHKDLQNRLQRSNFKLLRVVAKEGKSVRTDQLNKVLSHSDSAAEALLQSTSYYTEAENVYGAMLEECECRIEKALRVVAKGLRCVLWLQRRCDGVDEIDENDMQPSIPRLQGVEGTEERKLWDSWMEEKTTMAAEEKMAKAKKMAKIKRWAKTGRITKAKKQSLKEEMTRREKEAKKIEDSQEDDNLLRPIQFWRWKINFESVAAKNIHDYRALSKLLKAVHHQKQPDHDDLYFRDDVSEEQLQKEENAVKKFEEAKKKAKQTAKKNKELLAAIGKRKSPEDRRPFKIIDDEKKTPDRCVDFEEYNEFLCDVRLGLDKRISKYFLEVGAKRVVENSYLLANWRSQQTKGSKSSKIQDPSCRNCGESCTDQGALVFPLPCGHLLCQRCFQGLRPFVQCQNCGEDEVQAPKCHGQEQGHHCDPTALKISMTCGHLSCPSCLVVDGAHEIDCVKASCEIKTLPQDMKPATEFIGQNEDVCRYGGKLDAIIALIKAIDENDRVLLFVQFEILLQKVSDAFTKSGISHVALNNNERAIVEEKLEIFKRGEKKVLILNASADTAAGANLVDANHVVFVAPFNAKVSHAYHSSRTQCIGRALRHGQQKTVFVYDFLSLHTFDVDAFEYREGTKLVRKASADSEIWNMVPRRALTDEAKAQAWGSGYKYKFGDELMEDV